MTSKNFVNFLKQVFEEHGYTVEPTGKKGQVGIDLVIVLDGARIAVQAKGAQTEIVDNRVVEQTHAGKAMYHCQRSALISNSQFKPSARQLADRLGCKLIDAGQIPDLIEGRILL
jgi:HJR/Mrr/RecB family endonuclease